MVFIPFAVRPVPDVTFFAVFVVLAALMLIGGVTMAIWAIRLRRARDAAATAIADE